MARKTTQQKLDLMNPMPEPNDRGVHSHSQTAFSARDFWLAALVLTIGLLAYLPNLGAFGPLDPTDSFFIESGREAVETGNYIVPLDNYRPWLDKPILYFWAVAFCYKLFGVSAFAGRLASALSACALGLTIFLGSRPFLGRRAAVLASFIFLSCPLSSIVGHVSLTDMPLAFLMSAAMFLFAQSLLLGAKRNCLWGYFFLGLAILCKGPIAVILPCLAIGSFIFCSFGSADANAKRLLAIKSLRPVIGIGIVLAVNVPWYTSAIAYTHGAFFYDFFIRQNFGRMVGTVNHQEPWWFYWPVLFGGFFPWTTALLVQPASYLRFWARRLGEARLSRFLLFAISWALSILVVFGCLKTKLPTYILPAVAPLSVLAASQIELAIRLRKRISMSIVALFFVIAAAAVLIAGSRFHGYLHDLLVQCRAFLFVAVAASLAACGFGFSLRTRAAALALVVAAFVGTATTPMGMIAFYKDRQEGFDKLTQMVKDANASLAILIAEEPSAPFILHKQVPRLETPDDAKHYLASTPAPHWLLVPKECLQDLTWFSDPELKGQYRKWFLYAVK